VNIAKLLGVAEPLPSVNRSPIFLVHLLHGRGGARLLEAGVDVRFADLPAIEGPTGPLHVATDGRCCRT
jgi:hypothetical protein